MRHLEKLIVNGRYLMYEDNTPFFYLGDTAWELFHALNREEINDYLKARKQQGFNAIQAVALAEKNGLTVPNAEGRLPLKFTDNSPNPALPDTDGEKSYWDLVDYTVQTAEDLEIFIAMLPTWGDKFNIKWGKGPEVFNEENAYIYGKWIANRYKDNKNIIWMLGGDRPLENENHRKIIDAMAKGIKEVDKNHLITFHPIGSTKSTDFVLDADYIDFHTMQTGHSTDCYLSDSGMLKMAEVTPLPYLDSEPRYEDHPACFNVSTGYYWGADDIRQNAYWNAFAGSCGHTYGNHCIWSMTKEPTDYFPYTWKQALFHEGAMQMQYLKQLRESRDYFSFCHNPDLICENFEGMGHMTSGMGNSYGYVYSPLGIPFNVNLQLFNEFSSVRASWFNPRTGETKVFGVLPSSGITTVAPPSQGKGCDYVLILDGIK